MAQERLSGLLTFWEEKGIYDVVNIRGLQQAMLCPDPYTATQLLPPLQTLPSVSALRLIIYTPATEV
jgi:hypothetical protein